MKKMKFFLSCLSMLALAVSFTACDNDDPEEVVEVPAPVVSLTAGEAGETTLAFTLKTEKAKEAAWICVEKGATVSAQQVLTDGQAVDANKTLDLVAENLTAETEYVIYGAAKNGTKLTLSNPLEMKTLEAVVVPQDPTVSVAPVPEKVTKDAIAFTITSENAEEVKYAALPEMALEVYGEITAELIYNQSLDTVDPNTTVEVVKEVYMAETKFLVYAVAKAGETLVLSEPAEITTLPEGEEPGKEETTVVVAAVNEKTTTESITFTITSENADEVKYAVLPEMALEVYGEITPELIYNQSLQSVEPNTTVEVTESVYMEDTLFLVYAVAKKGEELVLSEKVEIKTLSSGGTQDDPIELATPVYASMTLTQGEIDKYNFNVADEMGAVTLQFDLYTEAGLKGRIPESEYPFAGAEAGMIDLSTLNLFVDGIKEPIVEGMLYINLYESSDSQSGWNAMIESELQSETQDVPYLLSYDGPIDRFGIPNDETGVETTVTIENAWTTRPTEDDGVTPLAGQFNVFFSYTDENSQPVLVTLCFNGPDLAYLPTGHYPVSKTALPAGWVNSEMSSVEAGIPPIPENLEPGDAYNVRVETMLDLEPTNPQFGDYYVIEFYIKTKGLYTPSKTIKATYKGALGFDPFGEAKENFDLYYNYLTTETVGSTMNLTFTTTASPGANFIVNIDTPSLPNTEGADWTWYNVNSGSITDPYSGKATLTEKTGRMGVKYLGGYYDSFEDKTYPEYQFITEGLEFSFNGMPYTSKNDWRSFCTSETISEPEVEEVDLVFTKGKAETSADGTRTVVDMSDDAGNSAHLVFRLASMYANMFPYLYGNGMTYMLGDESTGSEMWTEAGESTITYKGKTYKLPAADQENELFYGFSVTCGMPYADQNAISLIMPIPFEDITLNSFTFGGSLYANEEVVSKPEQDWSKVASGYKTLKVESNGTSHKVTLTSFSNGDMVFFVEGVESVYGKHLNIGKEITRESYLLQPSFDDSDGMKAMIYGNGYILLYSPTAENKVQVYTGYKEDSAGDTRLKFESTTNIICFDSGEKGWTATLQ